ncbi:unnamed protein product, partial [Oppiella nova]
MSTKINKRPCQNLIHSAKYANNESMDKNNNNLSKPKALDIPEYETTESSTSSSSESVTTVEIDNTIESINNLDHQEVRYDFMDDIEELISNETPALTSVEPIARPNIDINGIYNEYELIRLRELINAIKMLDNNVETVGEPQ